MARTHLRHLILAILLVPGALAALTPLDAGRMDAELQISGAIVTGERSGVDEAQVTLYWTPLDGWLQEVTSIRTEPDAQHRDGTFTFSWSPPPSRAQYRVTANITTRNAIVPVREKITFPLTTIPREHAAYLGSYHFTNTNGDIRDVAQTLADDTDDAYVVAYRIADWVTRNVNYSLASIGQPAIKPATDVLATRTGKCDELTALFISLIRAEGIPARFVTGCAYVSNAPFHSPYCNHGWAEVWFPDHGWIPFDVTVGEYGYLDAGHVKIMTSVDANSTSADTTARGRSTTLILEKTEVNVIPSNLYPKPPSPLRITASSPRSRVGLGGAALVLVNVENTRDYYVATQLRFVPVQETRTVTSAQQNVLLGPWEKKLVPFLIYIDDNLDTSLTYTFPFKILSNLGDATDMPIIADARYQAEDITAITTTINAYLAEPQPQDFTITCMQEAPAYAQDEIRHRCTIDGITTSSLRVCSDGCQTIAVTDDTFVFTDSLRAPGVMTKRFTGSSAGRQTRFFITSTATAPTTLRINLTGPASISVDDTLTVTVGIDATGAAPKDLRVTFTAGTGSAEDTLADLERPAILTFNVPARALRAGANTLRVDIAYTDTMGTQGSQSATMSVTLEDVGWVDRVLFVFDDIGQWFSSLVT